MTWQVLPVAPERFEDFADIVNPSRRAEACWCLAPRLGSRAIDDLGGGSREEAMRALCRSDRPPGVVAYLDGEPVAWCHISPRAGIPRLAGSKLIRPVDQVAVWSIICVVVRTGHRRIGATTPLLEGAVAYAADNGAPAVEAYPVEPTGRMNGSLAFVGTRSMFERVGFRVIGSTEAVAAGLPRLIMRRDLSAE